MMTGMRKKLASASFGTTIGSLLSIASFLLISNTLEFEKVGILGLHFIVSGLTLSLISCRAELIIPRLDQITAYRFAKEVITISLMMIPVTILFNYFIYNYALDIRQHPYLPLLTSIHTISFCAFNVFNAINICFGRTYVVFLSYTFQGFLYLAFTSIFIISGYGELEFYVVGHTISFALYPVIYQTIIWKLAPNSQARNGSLFPELIRMKKEIAPLSIQGLINSYSVGLLYFGVNFITGQSGVGVFTIAHKILSFPLRAVSLPLRQLLTSSFSQGDIGKGQVIAITAAIISIGIIFKVLAFSINLDLQFGSKIDLIVGNVQNLLLWWFGAIILIPATSAAIANQYASSYMIFEITIFISRGLGVISIVLLGISAANFIEVTSAIYFCAVSTFAIWALLLKEKK